MTVNMNIKKTILFIISGMCYSPLWAIDLTQSYQRALIYDAAWQAEQTRYEIEQQNLGIAKGSVLPTISVNASIAKQFQEVDNANTPNLGGQNATFINDETTTKQIALNLRQPLFRKDVWEKYQQVKISTDLAQVSLGLQKQNILLNVAESYFNVLRQDSLLTLAKKEENALLKQYEMMQAKFKQGFVAKMELSEAHAQYQSATAKRVSYDVQHQLAKEKFQQIIGQYDGKLAKLTPSFTYQAPYPAQMTQWVELAEQNNLELRRSQLSTRVARQQIKVDQADYYPQIEAVATTAWIDQSPDSVISTNGRNDKIGIEMNWNVFNGTRAKITEKSRLSALAAEQDSEALQRKIKTDVKNAYLQITTAQSQLNAFQVAMDSARLVANASQASYQEGLKTMVDVLLAQRSAFAAEQDYIHAQYDYLLNILKLKASSGQLNEQDLDELNTWLVQ